MAEKIHVEDYLDEDPIIINQKFFILSYILPDKNNEIDIPFFKVRGSYRTSEECEERIKRLKMKDNYFNLFICEVGKWGVLYNNDQLLDLDTVDNIYSDEHLNNLMKSKKENKDNASREFEERKRIMTERNKFEGSAEGQKYLKDLKESPIAVKSRIEFAHNEIKNLQDKITEMSKIRQDSLNTMKTYSKEELEVLKETKVNPTLVDNIGDMVKPSIEGSSNDLHKELRELSPTEFNNRFNEAFEEKHTSSFDNLNLTDDSPNFSSDNYAPITIGGSEEPPEFDIN